MRRHTNTAETPSRRIFLTGFLAGVGGVAALLSLPDKAHSAIQKPTVPARGPILYRRTPEVERYYRTLYL